MSLAHHHREFEKLLPSSETLIPSDICAECDKALAKARDARIGAMRELLISVKVIKVSFS